MSAETFVHVYWNRTLRIWSVRRQGIVVERRPSYALRQCVLHVGESARLRTQRPGAGREVHAWIKGIPISAPRPFCAVQIGYRPEQAGFRRRDTGAVVTEAYGCWFEEDGSCWASL